MVAEVVVVNGIGIAVGMLSGTEAPIIRFPYRLVPHKRAKIVEKGRNVALGRDFFSPRIFTEETRMGEGELDSKKMPERKKLELGGEGEDAAAWPQKRSERGEFGR